jgi:type II secretory pathway component PulF
MPMYLYQAVNDSGRNVSGTMPAPNESTLEQKLREAGLWLTDARVQAQAVSQVKVNSDRARKCKLRGGKGRRELIEFCTMMTFQIKAGITVVRALDVAAAESKTPGFREVVLDMQHQINSGNTLYETLSLYPGVFSLHFVSVVRAGELSSRLPESFEDLRDYYEWMDQIVAQVRQASIYPAIVMIVIACFTVFLFSFIVPKFAELLSSLKIQLPFLTKVIFGLGDFCSGYWWVWLVLAVVLGAGIPLGKRYSPKFAMEWDRMKLHYPIFGELNLMLSLSKFAHNFSILYKSGLPIIQAFKACENNLIGNKVIEQAVMAVGEEVKSGSTISEAMHRQPVFPALLVRMIAVGESSGNLDKALDNVAEYYNQVVPRRVKAVFSVAEPMLMLTLIGIVGCVALAIYLPILSLMDAVGK